MPHSVGRSMKCLAAGAYAALLVLIALWELWLAPATPVARGFWLILKMAPLLAFLPALRGGSPRAFLLTALLMLLYFSEGVATVYHAAKSGQGPALAYGILEIIAAAMFVVAASFYARLTWRRADLAAAAGKES